MTAALYTDLCLEGVVERVITVNEDQVDEFGRMRLGDLARQMQALTEQHFDQCSGMTIAMLNEQNLSWIIAWSELQIMRLPVLGEKIRIRIWAGKKKAVLHTRKYAFYTMDGIPLLMASSLFLLMDRNTRQAAPDPECMQVVDIVQVPDEPKTPKMNLSFPVTYMNQIDRTVAAEEIDYNGHLNNSHYLDWIESLPDKEYRKNHFPKIVWIEYSKELMIDQKVTLAYELRNDQLYVLGTCEGTQSFRVKAEYDI